MVLGLVRAADADCRRGGSPTDRCSSRVCWGVLPPALLLVYSRVLTDAAASGFWFCLAGTAAKRCLVGGRPELGSADGHNVIEGRVEAG